VRVIAGRRRGARLRVPAGLCVRPTLARARTSLFDILTDRGLVGQARILDLFAGSGALGIECLSRGADRVTFVEQEQTAARVLWSNVVATGFEERSSLVISSCAKAIRSLGSRGEKFDGVFVDPPWDSKLARKTLSRLSESDVLREDGWVAVHHRHGAGPEPRYGSLVKDLERRTGDSMMAIFRLRAGGPA